MPTSGKLIIAGLALLALNLIVGVAYLYPSATVPLVRPGDEGMVTRARSDADLLFRTAAEHRPATFPIVFRIADRTCVELRSRERDGRGSYVACYDRHARKLEEEVSAGF
jgi:hypothetical protein